MRNLLILSFLAAASVLAADYELNVLVDGKPLQQYRHDGRQFVEGTIDRPFTLQFRNNTSERVLAVPSVETAELSIYYASLSGLKALGVNIYPQAFAKVLKFCAVPQ